MVRSRDTLCTILFKYREKVLKQSNLFLLLINSLLNEKKTINKKPRRNGAKQPKTK